MPMPANMIPNFTISWRQEQPKLDITICKEIASYYSIAITDDTPGVYWSPWRAFFTGNYYSGPHATRSGLWDFFAGGVQNNFFFNLFSRPDYGTYIHFLNEIFENHPQPQHIFDAIKTAENTEILSKIISANKKYLSIKYQLDLQEQLTSFKRSEDEQIDRSRNTWSHRISKFLSFFAVISEGLINIRGASTVGFVAALGATAAPLFIACFIAGFVGCYLLYRKESAELLEEFFSGHLFCKNTGTPNEPHYEKLGKIAKGMVAASILLSGIAGGCSYSLAISAIQQVLTMLTITVSVTTVYFFALALIFAVGCVFFKATRKLIIAMEDHIQNKNVDEKDNTWKIIKICMAFIVSAIIGVATFFLFKKSLLALFASTSATATNLAISFAAITATMKTFLGISKINTGLGEAPQCLTAPSNEPRQEEVKSLTQKNQSENVSFSLPPPLDSQNTPVREEKLPETKSSTTCCSSTALIQSSLPQCTLAVGREAVGITHALAQGALFSNEGAPLGIAGMVTVGALKGIYSYAVVKPTLGNPHFHEEKSEQALRR